MRNQVLDAQNIYDARSSVYDNSWHPRFTQHVVHLAEIQSGQEVLDLACGTGLVTYLASTIVGSSGSVTGIDISSGMLKEAESKQVNHLFHNIEFFQHSITELDSLKRVSGKKFDVIICASALVLLDCPGEALRIWRSYLKPGGRLVTDVTHPASQLPQIALERVGRVLERPVPWYRVPFAQPKDLQRLMEAAGLDNVQVTLLSQVSKTMSSDSNGIEAYICDNNNPAIKKMYGVEDGDAVFEKLLEQNVVAELAEEGVREKARIIFKQTWVAMAQPNGKLYEVDGAFVGVGTNSKFGLYDS